MVIFTYMPSFITNKYTVPNVPLSNSFTNTKLKQCTTQQLSDGNYMILHHTYYVKERKLFKINYF